jgi:hypothetical protein
MHKTPTNRYPPTFRGARSLFVTSVEGVVQFMAMSSKTRIRTALSSWIEAHHLPGGYGGSAKLPDPEAHDGGPWGYLNHSLIEGRVYFRFLEHPMFERTWLRAIADIAQERVVAVLPPAAVLAAAVSTVTNASASSSAREAISRGAVVSIRQDADGEPEYLVLSPPTADAGVYTFGSDGYRQRSDSLAEFVESEVAAVRVQMPETVRFASKGTGTPIGWEYGAPPDMSPAEWPRHNPAGFPLAHGFTIELPDVYRVRKNRAGVPFVALSFFHPGNAEAVGVEEREDVAELFANPDVAAPEDAFLAAVHAHACALATPPSYERLIHTFADSLGHTHAVIFHTEASYRGGRASLPDARGEAFDEIFESFFDAESKLFPASRADRAAVQLGRPLHPMQGDETVRTMGYFVMELASDAGGANFADGTAQYDLETGAFDWAC